MSINPKRHQQSRTVMENVFNEYLDAIQEDMFRYAYQCGYEAAISQIAKGGVAV